MGAKNPPATALYLSLSFSSLSRKWGEFPCLGTPTEHCENDISVVHFELLNKQDDEPNNG